MSASQSISSAPSVAANNGSPAELIAAETQRSVALQSDDPLQMHGMIIEQAKDELAASGIEVNDYNVNYLISDRKLAMLGLTGLQQRLRSDRAGWTATQAGAGDERLDNAAAYSTRRFRSLIAFLKPEDIKQAFENKIEAVGSSLQSFVDDHIMASQPYGRIRAARGGQTGYGLPPSNGTNDMGDVDDELRSVASKLVDDFKFNQEISAYRVALNAVFDRLNKALITEKDLDRSAKHEFLSEFQALCATAASKRAVLEDKWQDLCALQSSGQGELRSLIRTMMGPEVTARNNAITERAGGANYDLNARNASINDTNLGLNTRNAVINTENSMTAKGSLANAINQRKISAGSFAAVVVFGVLTAVFTGMTWHINSEKQ